MLMETPKISSHPSRLDHPKHLESHSESFSFFHIFSVVFVQQNLDSQNLSIKSPPRQTGPANLSAVHSHQPVPGCVAEPLYLALAAHRSASSAHPGPSPSHEMYGTHYLIITCMISTITFIFMYIYIYTDM